jgi:hypothetical protein
MTWLDMERDADLLHAACERANREARSAERWDRILFATCAVIAAALIVHVTWWVL